MHRNRVHDTVSEAAGPPEQLPEPLSQAEARVLRFLQTSLSAPEIARELYVSVNTIRTHMRHLYDKLGAHRRLEAIDRARALGLLAPVPQRALPSSLPGAPMSRQLPIMLVILNERSCGGSSLNRSMAPTTRCNHTPRPVLR